MVLPGLKLLARTGGLVFLAAVSLSTGCADAGSATLPAGWKSGDVLVYDIEERDRALGEWPDLTVSRQTLVLTVKSVTADGAARVRLQYEGCALQEVASDTPPDMLAALRTGVSILCGPPIDVRLAAGSDALVADGDLTAVRTHMQTIVQAAFAPLDSSASVDLASRTIDELADDALILSDTREVLRLLRLPSQLPVSFSDERPNPHDGSPASWTHDIEWLQPDAEGQRRARWTMRPDPAAVTAALQRQWGSTGTDASPPADSNLGRALAGDVDLGSTTDYTFGPDGRVVHVLDVQEKRYGDAHERHEREARLQQPVP